jgi:hypothetical protein
MIMHTDERTPATIINIYGIEPGHPALDAVIEEAVADVLAGEGMTHLHVDVDVTMDGTVFVRSEAQFGAWDQPGPWNSGYLHI